MSQTKGRKKLLLIRTKLVEARYAKARQTIASAILADTPPAEDVDLASAYRTSRTLLGDYVTLDWKHRQDIRRIIKQIKEYADDKPAADH